MHAPIPRFTVITLGVSDMRASIAFYEALGFARKLRATGEAVAFFDTGGTVLGLFPWDQLGAGRHACRISRGRKTFRGMTLAWNCARPRRSMRCWILRSPRAPSLLKPAHKTDYGGYSGYFADPDNHPWEVVVAPGHRGRRRPAGSSAGLNRADCD